MGESRKYRIISMLLAVLLLCTAVAVPAMAAETDSWKTVKVACNINNALYLNEEGKPEGYCSEYLFQLAEINHWNLEYVPASWNDSVQNLYDGTIDLLFPTQMTEERIGNMGFSTAIGGYQPIGLFVRSDSDICYDDYDAFEGKKVALSAGTSNEDAMKAYAEQNGFTYESVYLNTVKEKEAALMDGTVDMVVFSTLNDIPEGKVVAMLDYLPFYYCTNIENTSLLSELNYGMNQMLIRHADLVQNVFYSFINPNLSFAYTVEEQKEIKEQGKIIVGIYKETEPLFGVTGDGTCEGIYKDLVARIKELSGLDLEIKVLNRKEAAFDYLNEGLIDFVLDSSDQALLHSDEKDYVQSEGVMDYYTINITRGDYNKTNEDPIVVALTNERRFWATEILKKNPKATFEYYASSKECLNAVQSGKADLTILNSWEYNYHSKNQKFENLMEWENSRTLFKSVFISQAGENALIRSVLNKAIEQISNAEKEQIIAANLNRPYDSYDFGDKLYEARDSLLIFGFVFLILIVGLGIFSIMRRRSMRVLEEKNTQLRESNEAKDLFLSRMSHELRTPLNAISGYATVTDQSVLEHRCDEQKIHSYMESIDRAVKYQLAIIGDLLDIQKIESGKMELVPVEVDSKDYMNNIIAMIQPEAEAKGVKFTYKRLDNVRETYLLDGVRFEQVLLNLLHNAVKFTPAGGRVNFTAEVIDQNETANILKFVISDTGIGMSEDFQQNYLFRRFAQEYKGNTSPYEGCGTGLAISRDIMHLMGGEITCQSKQGEGSVFTVILTAKHLDKKRKRRPRTDYSAYDLSGMKILLCEDNPMNQEIERRLLEKMNGTVDIAKDGQIGIDLFKQSAVGYYDVILMDIRMPNVDGLEATRAIRAMEREDAAKIPILAVSANSFSEDVQNSLDAGMNEHLAKPVDVKILYEKISYYAGKNAHTTT